MESKTLSKADLLRGLVELKANPLFQGLITAGELEVQESLNVLLHPSFNDSLNAADKRTTILGEMQGIRWLRLALDHKIGELTADVKAELTPVEEQQTQEQHEI